MFGTKYFLCLFLVVFFFSSSEAWISKAAQAAANAAKNFGSRVGKQGGGGNWVDRVQNSKTNSGGNQGRGKSVGGDSRSSSGNTGKKEL